MARNKEYRTIVKGNVQVSTYKNGKRVKVRFDNNSILNPEHWQNWKSFDNSYGSNRLLTTMSYKVGKKIMKSYTTNNGNQKVVYRLVAGSEYLTDESRMY